jgi:hypothetical protein
MVVLELLLCKMKCSDNQSDEANNNLLRSYLGDRRQFVRSCGTESSTRPVICGVPQGSVLGVIHCCRFHMYADDLQSYHSASISDLQRCYDEINSDLQRIID